ncbi:MAG: SsrA-binding protein SmpB [Pseudomonadota bacterium]|jgi:SsrA-binding protein
MAKKKPKPQSNTIVLNKKAKHDYFIEDKFEAGVSLQGWEVKSLREGKIQLVDSFVQLHQGEAYLYGAHITPLNSASTHYVTEPTRPRKLLLHGKELSRIALAIEAKGLTCVCTALYWKNHLVKAEIALAKGKKQHDKRATLKEQDWNREKQRVVRQDNR